MAGNTLGSRGKFLYISDGGVSYAMTMDEDLGEAAGLTPVTAANAAGTQRPPTRFKPRVVFVEAEIEVEDGEEGETFTARKALVVNADSTLYRTLSSSQVTIDGVAFATTGRRGEKLSF